MGRSGVTGLAEATLMETCPLGLDQLQDPEFEPDI